MQACPGDGKSRLYRILHSVERNRVVIVILKVGHREDVYRQMKRAGTVLVTGASGNLGAMVVAELERRGYRVRATDLDTPRNRRAAAAANGVGELVWADLRTVNFGPLLRDCIAVVHLGAVLPPFTENAPALAHDINVKASLRLVDDIRASPEPPLLVYPSSVSVFAFPEPPTRLVKADDPVTATDNYSAHKLEVEEHLAKSSIPWTVLRVGVAVDSRRQATDLSTARKIFGVAPDNPLEYVHPRDVASAMVNAIDNPRALGRVLLVGGGESCRVTHHRFLSVVLDAVGVGLPRGMLGSQRYYTCWMDTAESHDILQFQRHTFADYEQEMRRRLRFVRPVLRPFAPLLRRLLTRVLRSAAE